jgi:putative DNA primase/helicase
MTRDNEELRGVVNSGHTRATARVIRCVGEDLTPTVFSTWTPKVVGMIGRPADTLVDRSIVVELKRKPVEDQLARLRLDRLRDDLLPHRRRLRRWALDHQAAIRVADPDVPALDSDRAQDNWRPLLAVADEVGGRWPADARAAAAELTHTANEDQPLGVELLTDLLALFNEHEDDDGRLVKHLSTSKLVDLLRGLNERPWATYGRNEKGLTQHTLARLLKPFGVHSQKVKVRGTSENCYLRAELEEPWRRYVLQPPGTHSELGTDAANTGEIGPQAGSGSDSQLGTDLPLSSPGSDLPPGTGTAPSTDSVNNDGPGSEFRPDAEGPPLSVGDDDALLV